jgi:hypothetical protein
MMLSDWQNRREAHVAQLVELLICNQQVGGSNPSVGSKPSSIRDHRGGAVNP